MQKGFQIGLKEIRELQDKDKAYGGDESDEECTDIARLFFVYFKFKRQFDNAYKMLKCSPGIAKKVNHAFRRKKSEEMVRFSFKTFSYKTSFFINVRNSLFYHELDIDTKNNNFT